MPYANINKNNGFYIFKNYLLEEPKPTTTMFSLGGLRIMSLNEDRKNNVESPAVQSRIYCVEWGIGITSEEGFLEHLFTWRANALQNKI